MQPGNAAALHAMCFARKRSVHSIYLNSENITQVTAMLVNVFKQPQLLLAL
jgi:hypothetical protein